MRRAFTLVEVLIVIGILGGGFVAWKTGLMPGSTKRAKASTAATTALVQANDNQGAAAAASVVKIGEANAEAPDSPSKRFVAEEVPLTLTLLPAPDSKALVEAERRKVAVMEGRLDEARRLYETAAKTAERLQKEKDEAIAARQAADLAIEKAAAAEQARTMQAFGFGVVAFIALAAFVYVKLFYISPDVGGKIIASIKGGASPAQAFTDLLAPRQYSIIRKARKLATEPSD